MNRPHESLPSGEAAATGTGASAATDAGDATDASDAAAASTASAVGQSLPHESAALHVSGQAAYTDDLPELAGTLHAALGLSPVAHGWPSAAWRPR